MSRLADLVWAIGMDAYDLDRYLCLVAPPDTSWFQIRNLTAMRAALGRPLSTFQYEALRGVLAAHEQLRPGSGPISAKPK